MCIYHYSYLGDAFSLSLLFRTTFTVLWEVQNCGLRKITSPLTPFQNHRASF